MFKGENNAGVKAREYLQSLGYDGVNNGDEEYIAFYPEQIKLVDNTSPTESQDIRYSLMDDVYLDAVKRGDMATAQRMVDEAAKAAGYDSPKLYHGTDEFGFTEIKTQGVEKGVEWSPFWASSDASTSGTYATIQKVRRIGESFEDGFADSAIEDIESEIDDAVYDFCKKISRYFSEWVFARGGGTDVVGKIVAEYFDVPDDKI